MTGIALELDRGLDVTPSRSLVGRPETCVLACTIADNVKTSLEREGGGGREGVSCIVLRSDKGMESVFDDCNPGNKFSKLTILEFHKLLIFDFFAPWYRRGREASSVKFYKKIRRKSWSNVPPKLLACIGFLYKVVHKIGRLRKFNRSREIEFNFFTAWTLSMKFGTLVQYASGYKTVPQCF